MMEECVTYLRLNMIGMPGFVLQCAFQSFYMAAERPQLGTLMSIVAGVTNIVLDAILVWALGMGVTGAAIATAAGCLVGGLVPALLFLLAPQPRQSAPGAHASSGPTSGKACSNGLSEYVSSISMNIVTMCYNLQLMHYLGEDGVSAYGVVMYIAFIFAAVFIGYNIGITPIIGYHYGAEDIGEQRSLLRKSLGIIAVLGVLMAGSAEIFRRTAGAHLRGLRRGADRIDHQCHAALHAGVPHQRNQHVRLSALHRPEQRGGECHGLLCADAGLRAGLRLDAASAVRHRRHLGVSGPLPRCWHSSFATSWWCASRRNW